MPPWTPDDPWPSGTPGGAQAPGWGGYVRFWVRAGLAPGRPFTMGPHDNDRLDAGNVMAAPTTAGRAVPGERLWVDLTCDALDVTISGGARSSQGIFSKADAATLEVTLADPAGIYDPLNPVPPWTFGGQSRLVPGTPVEAFAEVVDGPTGAWQPFGLFTGTADSWGEDWTPHPNERRARLVATDATKEFVRLNRPEQPPAGDGDTVDERIARIVTFFDWLGTVEPPAVPSTVTLQATTMAQSAWELINRVLDDELGICYFTPQGALRYTTRPALFDRPPPVLELGCDTIPTGDAYDIIIDAQPSNLDTQMRNRVYAACTGGTTQTAESTASINRFGEYTDKRTDLGVEDDLQAAEWAQTVVQLYAFPQRALEHVVLRPDVRPASWEAWAAVLGIEFVTDLVRILWAPPDRPDAVVDMPARVVGWEHRITRPAWEVTWQLIAARASALSGAVFTMGPHANDRLDAGFVLG
jgi:hypothetical protein